jgi:BirA family transcriptional regulator, biotin operon repressor / biotin---[acetyl-CoA-carboxylase] ligase
MLAEDESEGAIAVAEVQTEGRGRLGRAWDAPAGTSVLVSVLLLPAVEAPRLPELSLVAGGAVAQAIAEVTGLEPAIKFPNDILVRSRKVAGILAESSEGRVVLGIGVNVNQTLEQLPADAKTEPTSLRLELGGPVSRARLLAAILLQLERAYDAWVTGTSRSG